MSAARHKRVERAQMRCLFNVPFFAPGVAKLPVVFDDTVNTACTNGQNIRFGTKFFDSLTDDQVVTVLCHEVAHCLLGHLWRAPGGCDWQDWNIATDHAVNLMLKEFSAQVMAQNKADPFPFPSPPEAFCADPQFTGMAEEQIYQRIHRQKPPGGGGGSGSAKGKSKGKPEPGSMPEFGQITQPQGADADPSAQKKALNDWKATMINSCQLAAGRGELPAGLARYVEGLVAPKVPWTEVLRSWLREQCADDWDFQKVAMEMSESGFLLPSLHSEKMGPVVFATDTSGSINRELLVKFQSEKQNCLDEMRPSKLVDIYCDSKVHKVMQYAMGDVIGRDAPGGGGTDFRPVWEELGKMPVTPKCVVYLTDLDGNFGDDPGCPVVWVTWTQQGKAPFGQVIYAGD